MTRSPDINTYFPMELLREIFLYCIEANQMKSGQLASVCRHWRSVITSIASLWSTLRVGTWTETEQVTTWLHRAYPKKVVVDTQRDREIPSEGPAFAALQNALTSTSQWNYLTISSFPPENVANQLGVQVASPMKFLKMLHVAPGCVDSSSFSHLLELVPTEAPLTELRLHASFASTLFLRPHWFSVLRNLTGLIINGRDIDEPFELFPTFTQLQIFEADRLHLPSYEPNVNLPLVSTLRKLRLRACSIQWMAGRQFPCLEECVILLPRHWATIRQHEVQLPSCKKLTYHGHPVTAAQYFRVPKMREMELRSHDCKEQRVYRHLSRLCRVDDRISKLTTLHLALQCSEQVLIKIMKYVVPLQELVLSIAYPSPSWPNFLESLAAKPSTTDWPVWEPGIDNRLKWKNWYTSQTWHADILPHLKYLGIQCPTGFSGSECLENCPILRLVGWTRAQLTPPLEHLNVWEGRGTTGDIVVDYIGTDYLDKHLRTSVKECDEIVVRGMATRCLCITDFVDWSDLQSQSDRGGIPVLQLHSTALFRLLEDFNLSQVSHDHAPNHDFENLIFPFLNQIKRLEILGGAPDASPLKSHFPLVDTLQRLKLQHSPYFWMLGWTFKALREFVVEGTPRELWNLSRHEGLQVGLPACTILRLDRFMEDHLRFFSCPNVQIFHLVVSDGENEATLKCQTDFLFYCSCLQELQISFHHWWKGRYPLMQFVFCDAQDQGVWRDIRSVEVHVRHQPVWQYAYLGRNGNPILASIVEHQQHYAKRWKEFTVTEDPHWPSVIVRASM